MFDPRYDIRAAQALLGPAEVKTSMMSARVLNLRGRGGGRVLDCLRRTAACSFEGGGGTIATGPAGVSKILCSRP